MQEEGGAEKYVIKMILAVDKGVWVCMGGANEVRWNTRNVEDFGTLN